jgi:hypothetical protein
MAEITTADEALEALAEVVSFANTTFGAHHEGRLGQLRTAVATARMAVEHLVDEEVREVDLAQRIVRRDKVHGQDEAASPVGRPYVETLRIAGVG